MNRLWCWLWGHKWYSGQAGQWGAIVYDCQRCLERRIVG